MLKNQTHHTIYCMVLDIYQINMTSKSKDFDSSKTESFGSARNQEEFRHAQKFKKNKKISDTSEKEDLT